MNFRKLRVDINEEPLRAGFHPSAVTPTLNYNGRNMRNAAKAQATENKNSRR